MRQCKQIACRWTCLALAADGRRGDLRWAWTPTVRKEALAPDVAARREAGLATVIWDSSGSHRARLFRDSGVPLIPLPADALEPNPAERIFEEVRRVSEGRIRRPVQGSGARPDGAGGQSRSRSTAGRLGLGRRRRGPPTTTRIGREFVGSVNQLADQQCSSSRTCSSTFKARALPGSVATAR